MTVESVETRYRSDSRNLPFLRLPFVALPYKPLALLSYPSARALYFSIAVIDRQGRVRVLQKRDMAFGYRQCGAPDDFIFTQAVFQGAHGHPAAIF